MKANEPGTLKYEVTRSLRPAKDGTEEIVMLEKFVVYTRNSQPNIHLPCCRYKDQQALKTHGGSEKFQAFQKTLAAKDLMRARMTLKMVSEKGGFSSRL